MAKDRFRADQLAFMQGLAESREKAKSLIMAGRIVYETPSGHPPEKTLKPGQQLAHDARLQLLPGKTFVSRGAYKLLTILDALNIVVQDKICIDAGASTGGFTDCLLQKGAKRVYAIDVGHNQLHEKLRADPRVISLEGVNIRHAEASLLPEQADFITGDLSFISLVHIVPALLQWAKPEALLALLIKPQFELGPDKTVKGVVKKEEDREKAVQKIVEFCTDQHNLALVKILPASIRGPRGNQEYIALFKNGPLSG